MSLVEPNAETKNIKNMIYEAHWTLEGETLHWQGADVAIGRLLHCLSVLYLYFRGSQTPRQWRVEELDGCFTGPKLLDLAYRAHVKRS